MKQSFSIAFLCFFMLFKSQAQVLVCFNPQIAGAETQYIAAKRVLSSSTTSNLNSTKIYVDIATIDDSKYVYFHSNHVVNYAHKFENADVSPTKFIEDIDKFKGYKMERLVKTIVDAHGVNNYPSNYLKNTGYNNITFYLTPKAIKNKVGDVLLLEYCKNVKILDDYGRIVRTGLYSPQELVMRRIKNTGNHDNVVKWLGQVGKKVPPSDDDEIAKEIMRYAKAKKIDKKNTNAIVNALKKDVREQVYYTENYKKFYKGQLKITDQTEEVIKLAKNVSVRTRHANDVEAMYVSLKGQRYLKKEIEIISLVDDDATTRTLQKLFTENHTLITVDNIKKLFSNIKKKKKKTLFFLGHIEGKSFVTRDANNKERFRLTLDEIADYEKLFDVNVIVLGCESASKVSNASGVVQRINTVNAVEQLHRTMKENSNLLDLLKGFSNEKHELVLDPLSLKDRGFEQYQMLKVKRRNRVILTVVGGGVVAYLIYDAQTD